MESHRPLSESQNVSTNTPKLTQLQPQTQTVVRVKFSILRTLLSAGGPCIKKKLVRIVTFSMHLSMLTPQSRQTEGIARPDNQVYVC